MMCRYNHECSILNENPGTALRGIHFNLSMRSRLNGEESQQEISVDSSFSADRITPHWKISLDVSTDYDYESYETDNRTISSITRTRDFRGLVVKSFGEHWSAEEGATTDRHRKGELKMMKSRILTGLLSAVFMLSGLVTVSGQEMKKLPEPRIRGQVLKALKNRVSIKGFKQKELSDQVLSELLWAAFGIVDRKTGRRTAPSAFNAREIDIYVLKADGVFLYDPEEHGLKGVNDRDIRSIVAQQGYARNAPVQLVYVADYERADSAYPGPYDIEKRRWAMMHTGFICQNVMLYGTTKKISTVVRSFGNREGLRRELHLDDKQEIIITQAVGYAPK